MVWRNCLRYVLQKLNLKIAKKYIMHINYDVYHLVEVRWRTIKKILSEVVIKYSKPRPCLHFVPGYFNFSWISHRVSAVMCTGVA